MKQITLAEIFYLCYVGIMFFAKGIGLYDGQFLFTLLLVIAVIFYCLKMLMTSYAVKELVMIALLILAGGLTYVISGEKGILIYIFMVTGMKNVPLKRIFTVGLATWTISFGGMFLLTATKIVASPFKIHEKFGLGFFIRWGLGHSHPNVLHISYLTFAMLVLYVLGKRVHLQWLGLLMAGNLYVYLYSLSNTGVIAVTFLLALNLYFLYRERLAVIEKILINLLLPGCLLFSFALPFVFYNTWVEAFYHNSLGAFFKTLASRLLLSHRFLSENPLSLFGANYADILTRWITLDSSFVFVYVVHGVVLSFVIFIAYLLIIFRFTLAEKKLELSIILTTLLAGLSEPFLFNTSFKNLSLFFLALLLFTGKARKELRFLPDALRGITVKIPELSGFRKHLDSVSSNWNRHRQRIFLIFIVAGLLGAGIAGFFMPQPEAIMAPAILCDETDQESFYLSSLAEAEAANVRVIGYVDGETEMLVFSGNTIILERVRAIVTGGLLLGALCSGGFLMIGRKKL